MRRHHRDCCCGSCIYCEGSCFAHVVVGVIIFIIIAFGPGGCMGS